MLQFHADALVDERHVGAVDDAPQQVVGVAHQHEVVVAAVVGHVFPCQAEEFERRKGVGHGVEHGRAHECLLQGVGRVSQHGGERGGRVGGLAFYFRQSGGHVDVLVVAAFAYGLECLGG